MADVFNLGVFSVDTSGNVTANKITTAVGNALTATAYVADGAIDPTDSLVVLDGSSASAAMTLAAGADGAQMTIICVNSDNTCDVDADFGAAIATATFTVGDGVQLVSYDSVWYVVGNNGAVLS